MNKKKDIESIISLKERRLQELKKKQALQGISTEPQTIIEIEDLETEITKLLAELEGEDRGPSTKEIPSINTLTSLEQVLTSLGVSPIVFKRENLEIEGAYLVHDGILPAVLIQGLPGYGKTVLLGELTQILANEFQYIFVSKFVGRASVEILYFIEEVNQFLKSLGYGIDIELIKNNNYEYSLKLLMEQMSKFHILLVLDAVDNIQPEIINTLLRLIPASKNIQLIMTARSRVVNRLNAHILNVPPMTDVEANGFIEYYCRSMKTKIDAKDLLAKLPTSVKENPQSLALLISNMQDIPLELLLAGNFLEDTLSSYTIVKNILLQLDNEIIICLTFILMLGEINLVELLNLLDIRVSKHTAGHINVLIEKSIVYRQESSYCIPSSVSEILIDLENPNVDNTIRRIVKAVLERKEDIRTGKLAGKNKDLFISLVDHLLLKLSQLRYYEQILEIATEDFVEMINFSAYWKEYWLILRVSFDAAKQLQNRDLIGTFGFRIVRKSTQVNDLESGRRALIEVEATIGQNMNESERAKYLSHKAIFTEIDGDKELALNELLDSHRIFKALDDDENAVFLNILIGNFYMRQRDYEKARAIYEKALAMQDSVSLPIKTMIEVDTSLSYCDLKSSNIQASQNRLWAVIEKCYNAKYKAGLPRAYYYLALTCSEQGANNEAIEYAQKAYDGALQSDRNICMGASLLIWRLKNGY